jgi:hypothetical protein
VSLPPPPPSVPGSHCGAPCRDGHECKQRTDVWPCRYHDAAAFTRFLDAVAAVVRECGGWPNFLGAHERPLTLSQLRGRRRTG